MHRPGKFKGSHVPIQARESKKREMPSLSQLQTSIGPLLVSAGAGMYMNVMLTQAKSCHALDLVKFLRQQLQRKQVMPVRAGSHGMCVQNTEKTSLYALHGELHRDQQVAEA